MNQETINETFELTRVIMGQRRLPKYQLVQCMFEVYIYLNRMSRDQI